MVASLPRLSQPSTSVILKVVSCIAACAIVFYIRTRLLFFPCTFYGLCQLGLADINRRKGLRRLNEAEQRYEATNGNDGCNSNNWFIASVVGYREEPVLWKRTLKSYLDSVNVETILLGIDGNGAEDLEMADAVIEVRSTKLPFPGPENSLLKGLRCNYHRNSSSTGVRTNCRAPGRTILGRKALSQEETQPRSLEQGSEL